VIKRSLIIGGLLVVAYIIVIAILQPKSNSGYLQQYSIMNEITVDRYIAQANNKNIVIAGTSISNNIMMDSLPNVFNLSLRGESISDALYIIEKQSAKPKFILIETNLALKDPSTEHFEELLQPEKLKVRSLIHAFRKEYQPIALFKSLITYTDPNLRFFFTYYGDSAFRFSFKQREKEFSLPLDSAKTFKRFERLSRQIKNLESEGVKIVFFEVPIDNKLSNLPYQQTVRKLFKSTFADTAYTYIPLPQNVFNTSDGMHLTIESSQVYTHYFKQFLTQKNIL
jgi:hypothetical protein